MEEAGDRRVVFTGTVPASHHQFELRDGDGSPGPSGVLSNSLVAAKAGGATVFTGIHTGVARLTTEATSTPAGMQLDKSWEEIVEVSLHCASGQLIVAALFVAVTDPFPNLAAAGRGWYRLRVHARGRDTEPDGVAYEPFEDYLIQTWPAPPAPEHTAKQTDEYGAEILTHQTDPIQPAPLSPAEQEYQLAEMADEAMRRASLRAGREAAQEDQARGPAQTWPAPPAELSSLQTVTYGAEDLASPKDPISTPLSPAEQEYQLAELADEAQRRASLRRAREAAQEAWARRRNQT